MLAALTLPAALLLLGTFSGSGSVQSPAEVEAILRAVVRDWKAGDLPAARAGLARAHVGLAAFDLRARDPVWADLLFAAGELDYRLGDIVSARRSWEAVRDVRARLLPADDPAWQSACMNLAVAAKDLGDLGAARDLEEAVLEARERTLPPDHVDLIKIRSNLALTLAGLGMLSPARGLLEQACAAAERALSADDPLLQEVRTSLGEVLAQTGALARARELFEGVVAAREAHFAPDSLEVATARGNLGNLLQLGEEYAAARPLQEQALAAFQSALPPDHPRLLAARGALAGTLARLGELQRARELQAQVLAGFERVLPPEHPDVVLAREQLAVTWMLLGQPAPARVLFERVLAVRERTLPEDHPALQVARQGLAAALRQLGDVPAARALVDQALAACERNLPEESPVLQYARANAGTMRLLAQDWEGARATLSEVLEARERRHARGDPELERTRIMLAFAVKRCGDLDEARQLEEESLAALTAEPHTTPTALGIARTNLAVTLREQGELDRALELFERAVSDDTAHLPPGHLRRLEGLENLTWTRHLAGDAPGSLAAARRLQDEMDLAITALAVASMRERGERSARIATSLSTLLSLPRGTEGGEDARLFGLAARLRAAALTPPARDAGDDPHAAEAERRSRVARAHIHAMVSSVAAGGPPPEAARLAELARERDAAEAELEACRSALVVASPPVDAAALARALAPGAALVLYHRWEERRPPAERRQGHADEARILAWALDRTGRLERLDLGRAEDVAAAVERWRRALGAERGTAAVSAPERGVAVEVADPAGAQAEEVAGSRLRALVLDPILARLPAQRVVFVCPDDALHLVPLDALPLGEPGLRVGDALRVRSVANVAVGGRSPPGGRPDTPEVVLVGAVEFGAAGSGGSPTANWPALPGTADEVRALAELFEAAYGSAARVLTGARADKRALVEAAPRATHLHIATHGWAAPEVQRAAKETRELDVAGALPEFEAAVAGLAPMALSGLTLAGANRGADVTGTFPGLLTAEELAGFDLSRCDLAVLSACDTSLGLSRAGLGVWSLQRALHAAGARSVVASLWPVPDEATSELMLEFYRRLWVGKESPDAALWAAKRALRGARGEAGEPRFGVRDWGAWVLISAEP